MGSEYILAYLRNSCETEIQLALRRKHCLYEEILAEFCDLGVYIDFEFIYKKICKLCL